MSIELPTPINMDGFNPDASLPHGCGVEHIRSAMSEFIQFLTVIDKELYKHNLPILEAFLMPANFSSMVGEFMTAAIPKYCDSIVKNQYHNGHPDLIPSGKFEKNAILHGEEGIEIKASRHLSGWQGHNPEDVWLLVFVFESCSPRDEIKEIAPKPFKFIQVLGGELTRSDWNYSGRSETSRRTITASVNKSGYEKMKRNWIYKA